MAYSNKAAKRGNAMPIIPWDYGEAFSSIMILEDVAADTPYILVDLSDTTNYPHEFTTELLLHGIRLHMEALSSGVYNVYIGVILELDATNGTAQWIHQAHFEGGSAPLAQAVPFNSLPLGVDTTAGSEKLQHVASNSQQAGHTNWQNDVYLTTHAGSAIPAVGDLVMWIDEVSGTGTLSATVGVDYDSQ